MNTNTNTHYAIKVGGVIMGKIYESREIAMKQISFLPLDQQSLAEVVNVTVDGRELLLG